MDTKPAIQSALTAFPGRSLFDAAIGFFDALGYRSDRRVSIPSTPEDFLATFAADRVLDAKLALLHEWQAASFLFQLTSDEIRSLVQNFLDFGGRGNYDANTFDSYLFVTIQLAGSSYNRTQLAGVVRAVNRLFPQPVFLLFRHGETISLGIIHRRPGLRDPSRDVLEKVTLIKDIRCDDPIRAHVDILAGFSLDALQAEHPFYDFTGLHRAWEKQLATDPLNKQFYSDIANWYFWALKTDTGIIYPRDIEKTDPKQEEGQEARSIFLIRLLTRLIFCWFLQEKGLVPRDLFRRHVAEGLLKDASLKAGTYYRAVLQNLFFATLNQEMDARGFRRKSKAASGRDGNRGATGLFRYADLLTDSDALLDQLATVPFLNGGLFDCLDRVFTTAEKTAQEREDVRLDDFSEEKSNTLHLPNDLFFGGDRWVDLTHIFRDPKKAPAKPIEKEVSGLLTILSRYKFTVLENTPFEEEIALDPELLGKVFENLLASYNEDTRTTARKATGSFYTPREIVAYMVDEALGAYLRGAVPLVAADGSDRLAALIAAPPADIGNAFKEEEKVALIAAIDRVKILDPACGSGAFPMGVLHRLVDLLLKLDPHNRRWKQQQLRKVERDRALAAQMEDEELRTATLAEADERAADIQRSFNEDFHDLDFARKLYLIENCIYGVDIQPIATQIAKLRFFISLIVDQRTDKRGADSDAPNRGVRPLPNLETKIVAADFLIPIERTRQVQAALFTDDSASLRKLKTLRERLEIVRHEHFGARTSAKKAQCRQRDAELRQEMAKLLRETGMSAPQSNKLADWDPYDQNAHAPFFDADWMFNLNRERQRERAITVRDNFAFVNEVIGQTELRERATEVESGFDVVIGNPPYIRLQTLKQKSPKIAEFLKGHYVSASRGNYDLYVVFVEAGLISLKHDGNLAYILPHKFFNAEYGEPLRGLLAKGKNLHEIVHFGDQQVFPGATNYVCLLFLHKRGEHSFRFVSAMALAAWLSTQSGKEGRLLASVATSSEWSFAVGAEGDLLARLNNVPTRLGDIADMFVGLQTSADTVFLFKDSELSKDALTTVESNELGCVVQIENDLLKPVIRSGSIGHYWAKRTALILFPYEQLGNRLSLISESSMQSKYPHAWAYLLQNKKLLANREHGKFADCGWYQLYPKNLDLWEQSKLMLPYMISELSAFFDEGGSYFVNVTTGGFGITLQEQKYNPKFITGLLNTKLENWFLQRVSTNFRGGYFAANKQFLVQLPIPTAVPKQQTSIELIVNYLLWLHRQPEVMTANEPRDPLMVAFWEQLVNALVYELFFPAELADAHLAFFHLVDEADLHPLDALADADAERLHALRTAFERLNVTSHPLRAALFTLAGLDFVRLIEGRT